MKNINQVVISGNLTKDAELRSTQSGLSVLTIGVAVNDSRKNANGEWEDYANFIDCVMIGERAQKLAQHIKKGTKVAVNGKLRQSRWEKDGQKRSKVEVVIDQLEFMQRKEPEQAQGYYDDGYADSDIPF